MQTHEPGPGSCDMSKLQDWDPGTFEVPGRRDDGSFDPLICGMIRSLDSKLVQTMSRMRRRLTALHGSGLGEVLCSGTLLRNRQVSVIFGVRLQ